MTDRVRVRDSFKEFHSFKGDGVRYSRDGDTYDIFIYEEGPDGETRRRDLGSFVRPMWCKADTIEDKAKPSAQSAPKYNYEDDAIPADFLGAQEPEPPLDPFTQSALESASGNAGPSIEGLKKPEGGTSTEGQCTGPDIIIDDPLAPGEAHDSGALQETFESLKDRLGTKPEKVEQEFTDAKGRRKQKKKAEDTESHGPVEGDEAQVPVIAQETVESPASLESDELPLDPPIRDVDVAAVLSEAENRHKEKPEIRAPKCKACRDTGIVERQNGDQAPCRAC